MREGGLTALFYGLGIIMILGVVGTVVAVLYAALRPAGAKKSRPPFPKARLDLLRMAAAGVGGEVIDLPAKYRVPFFRVANESARYAVVLASVDETVDGPYHVCFEAPVDGRLFVEAWPEGSPFQPLRVASGAPEVKTGEPEFDRTYVVRTDDVSHARAVLSAEMRKSLARLRRLGGGGRMRFDLYAHKVVLQKEEAIADANILGLFVAECLVAFAALKEALETQAGIEFFDAPASKSKATCPICGTEITKGRVACRRCKTPHHDECWTYFGACSMFACGEKSFELA